jgi:hypothetical protein
MPILLGRVGGAPYSPVKATLTLDQSSTLMLGLETLRELGLTAQMGLEYS